jgi:enoyl-CoA hydratase/carnithine racemase
VDKIDLEVSGKVAIISINRPERRNAVNQETAGELLEAFEAFD